MTESGGIDSDSEFVVAFEDFQGPLDLLLDLAKSEKIDLRAISIVALADQFIDYLQRARSLKLEIAGEYLVMAAWLAYLKSRLLLPEPEEEEEDPETLAGQLADRLRTLEAIRSAVAVLETRPRLGIERFGVGNNEGLGVNVVPLYRSNIAGLLRAYARVTAPKKGARLQMRRRKLMTVQQALEHLARDLVGRDWRDLLSFLPVGLLDDMDRNGAIAANLVAGLELARQGAVEIDQNEPFGTVRIRRNHEERGHDGR
jgi:segregation and condensation protein A